MSSNSGSTPPTSATNPHIFVLGAAAVAAFSALYYYSKSSSSSSSKGKGNAGSTASSSTASSSSSSSADVNTSTTSTHTASGIVRDTQHRLTVFKAHIVNPVSVEQVDLIEHGILGVDSLSGQILFIGDFDEDLEALQEEFNFDLHDTDNVLFVDLHTKFLVPGFVDTHAHAPQYVNCGTGGDEELLEWLNKYTFKAESRCRDTHYAHRVYDRTVKRTLRNGTTTIAYYGTIHTDATLVLAKICAERGQRALVGKVCQDQNTPTYYIEPSTEASLKETERFVHEMHLRYSADGLVKPIITPRFAISCSIREMKGLASIAHLHDLHIQTHLSENHGEIEYVHELFPNQENYTAVYDHCQLLTDKTVLAHCIHLSDDELELIHLRGSSIAHCPSSNFQLESGVLDLHRILDKDVKVGLGTDISGGPGPSMLSAIRQGIIASKTCRVQALEQRRKAHEDHPLDDTSAASSFHVRRKVPEAPVPVALDYKQMFFLATLGGAQALAMDDVIGSFEPHKEFDALVIDPFADDSPFDVFDKDELWDIFQKFLMLGDDRNIEQVYVRGLRVVGEQ